MFLKGFLIRILKIKTVERRYNKIMVHTRPQRSLKAILSIKHFKMSKELILIRIFLLTNCGF